MQERPHLTRLLGVASLVAALALLFRIVAAITSMTAPDQAFATTAGWTSAGARLHADEERAAAIRDTIRSLREECQRSAGGDWNRWVEQLSPFRASLLKRIREAKPYNLQAEGSFEARSSVLEGRGDFALFEILTGVLSSIPVRSRIAGRIPQATSRGRRGSLAQEPGHQRHFCTRPQNDRGLRRALRGLLP